MNRQCVGRDEIVTKVDSTFENLDQQRTQGLGQLQQVQTVQTTALQREQQRLTAKYGEAHPRVQKIDTRLTYNQGAQKDLTQEIKRSKISVPQFDPKTWKGHGLILDQNEVGIQGLTVSLSDANATWIQALGYACTNEEGYFSIIYPKETDSGATAPNVPDGQPLFLTVTNADRQQLHRERTARTFKIGQIEYWRIVLGEGDRPTCEPPPPDDKPAIAVQITAIDTPEQLTVNKPGNFNATVNPDATLPIAADWDFGDGTTAKGLATTHSYTKPGGYSVTVTVSNSGGGDSRTTRVAVEEAPQKAVQVVSVDAPEQLLVNQVGRFSATVNDDATPPVQSVWKFGDDTTGESLTATHAYTKPGTYSATVTASNPDGKDSRTVSVIVREPSTAVRVVDTAVPQALTVNDAGDFSAKINEDATPPVKSVWEFGDGTTAEGLAVTHAYTKAGSYAVTFTAANSAGKDSRSAQLRVQDSAEPPQIGEIQATPPTLTIQSATRFTAEVKGNAPLAYQWDFGDNTSSSTQVNPSHTYARPGTYTVTLKVSNAAGSDGRSLQVIVTARSRRPG